MPPSKNPSSICSLHRADCGCFAAFAGAYSSFLADEILLYCI